MPTPHRFEAGRQIRKREVWDGAVWLEHPVRVDSDEGPSGVLAVVLEDGSPFTFPEHPGTRHPWAGHDAWRGPTVLQLRRAGDWYSVWKFFGPAPEHPFRHWYVNFERPLVRGDELIDTDDLELDLLVHPDGRREWKDVEQLHARLAERRFGLDALAPVLEAAGEVWDRLDRDDRWWARWDGWTPG